MEVAVGAERGRDGKGEARREGPRQSAFPHIPRWRPQWTCQEPARTHRDTPLHYSSVNERNPGRACLKRKLVLSTTQRTSAHLFSLYGQEGGQGGLGQGKKTTISLVFHVHRVLYPMSQSAKENVKYDTYQTFLLLLLALTRDISKERGRERRCETSVYTIIFPFLYFSRPLSSPSPNTRQCSKM